MKLSNSTYDTLKWVAQILIPALGALYFGLAQIWGFPKGEEVVGSLTIIDVFLGAILGLSAAGYKNDDTRFDGEALIKDFGETKGLRLVFDGTIEELAAKDEILFKVDTNPQGMEEYDVPPPE